MGWWQRDAAVIGDSVADYMDSLKRALGGIPWRSSVEIPAEVRKRIAGFYLRDSGREPTDHHLDALLAFAKVGD